MVYVWNNLLFSHLKILIKEYVQMVKVKKENQKNYYIIESWILVVTVSSCILLLFKCTRLNLGP